MGNIEEEKAGSDRNRCRTNGGLEKISATKIVDIHFAFLCNQALWRLSE
jgi:hypothetical protein